MRILFQQRRLTSLIVSLAILLNLCAPAISHAMSALSATPLALEICSATPNATAGKRAPAGLPAHGVKHCMLCAVHATGAAPPPAEAGLLAVLEGHDAYPALRAAAAPQHLIWSDAQPRGPPAAA
ncbi:DUF2946 domain-containing protein [Pseudoduganella sp. FT25W]|uniref:DUF2946 domain-containing protein n=1 Tax=Duganella alba TaxID=2666081 RepID=A0A6L5QKW3_9BURK|nr:DUF2946 family protein [Duganella alba]MRX10325.1 DUF2946 domain-containing protein [Duganella alba]MRX20049.1 DUF2946 domain-containing protein [Duganella alba]